MADPTDPTTHSTTAEQAEHTPSALTGLYDDLLARMDQAAAIDGGSAHTPDGGQGLGTGIRLALPLSMEMIQAIRGETPGADLADWQTQLLLASPGGHAGTSGSWQWSPEQHATIVYLRQVQASIPQDLEAWRARVGLPSRGSTEEPWVQASRAVAPQTMHSPPTAAAVVDALPPPAAYEHTCEQTSNVRTDCQEADGDESAAQQTGADVP
jgi:hypothetical protein